VALGGEGKVVKEVDGRGVGGWWGGGGVGCLRVRGAAGGLLCPVGGVRWGGGRWLVFVGVKGSWKQGGGSGP